ncbi:hypothetical protein BDZ45DRAFT_101734 [Acephala macrosclerotiorum]|nr:hypothetical protein BDZ45DRAFT_101734 [Acephala macrosclerotiorum]
MVADSWLVTSVPFCIILPALVCRFRFSPSIITRLNPSRLCGGVLNAPLSVRCAAFGQLTRSLHQAECSPAFEDRLPGTRLWGIGRLREDADGSWSLRSGCLVKLERGLF